jgi:hypothetical protein
MNREISRWSVGPSIVMSAGVYAAVAGLATVAQSIASAAGPIERSVQERIETRGFPSVLQSWNPAQNVHDESPLHTVALGWKNYRAFGPKSTLKPANKNRNHYRPTQSDPFTAPRTGAAISIIRA